MRTLLAATLVAASVHAAAECTTSLPLKGGAVIRGCDPKSETCVPAPRAVYDYSLKLKGNDDPQVLNMQLHASPWRFYDADMRILEIEEVADLARPFLAKGVKRVFVFSSWSAVRPDPTTPPLAERLARALRTVPVTGTDGFIWLRKDGTYRTSQQASTVRQGGGPYHVAQGEEVLVSLAVGWFAPHLEQFAGERNAGGVHRAAAAWDIYHLCPERALQGFELAAKLGHPPAGYNAALMRLARNAAGDREAAIALLAQAAKAGDPKSTARLAALRTAAR